MNVEGLRKRCCWLTLVAVLVFIGTACQVPNGDLESSTTGAQSETITPDYTTTKTTILESVTTTSSLSSAAVTGISDIGWTAALLKGLAVADASAPVSYDRDDWGSGWSDADRDCMNTRHEVLKEESLSPAQTDTSGCKVVQGRWYAAFTGTWVTDPSELDIDHFVPLANAHVSGGWAWPSDKKRAFYNDLADPKHLIAVTASANRSKGSRGPESWKPNDVSYWCVYAHSWASIKSRWELTVTTPELAALTSMLDTCSSEPASTWTPPPAPAFVSASTTIQPTTIASATNPGNTKNCSDFSSYSEAKAWFDRYFPDFGDVARLDGDNDGEPCESLPGGP